MPQIELATIVGPTELADLFHVKRSTVMAWHYRRNQNPVATKKPGPGTGFPEDLHTRHGIMPLARGNLFDIRECAIWWLNWTPERHTPKLGWIDPQDLKELGIGWTQGQEHTTNGQ